MREKDDVHNISKVHIQLNLEAVQDRALKARAREQGVSEAEFVCQALDAALYPSGSASSTQYKALENLLGHAGEFSQTHRFHED